MKQIEYYVATSIDGFIAGENEDVSGFLGIGNGVQKYLDDLKEYETVIMGRKTYEFGYKFGLKPGDPAYAHMEHFIFSKDLSFENQHDKINIANIDINEVIKIREEANTNIYLCGGGVFAGWLLEHEQIDILKLKVNPLLLGKGIKLFGESKKDYDLDLIRTEEYDAGLLINTYRIKY